MYANAPVKMLIPAILDVLSRYTDSRRTLTQKEITEILEREYYMKTDRKTVGRNLRDIIEYDNRVHALTEIPRTITDTKTGEVVDTTILNDFYMDRLFDDTEIQALIYDVVFSKYIPASIKKSMVDRLRTLGNRNADLDINTYAIMPDGNKKYYNELFLNLELLKEAINEHKKISFRLKYRTFNESVKTPDVSFIFSPFKIGVESGEYLVSGFRHFEDGPYEDDMVFSDIERFPIHKMKDIVITDEDSVDIHDMNDIGSDFDYSLHIAKEKTMAPSKKLWAKFDVKGLENLHELVAFLREENIISVVEEEPMTEDYPGHASSGRYTVTVRGKYADVISWGGSPYSGAEITEPEDLRQYVKERFSAVKDPYGYFKEKYE